jgi:hypothetical protein
MRISDQFSHISQTLGRAVVATATALHSMVDARTGLVTAAVWAIAERASCCAVQARRDLHLLAREGIIEIDVNQKPDMMQEANSYRWIGVGAYEQARVKQARLKLREQQRALRLQHNENKRAQKAESLEAMIARRIGKGIRDGIALYWEKHAQSFAPLFEVRALQESPYIFKKNTLETAVEGFRLRREERLRRT